MLLICYLIPRKYSGGLISPITDGNMRFHIFLKVLCLKGKIIMCLEFGHVFYDLAVKHVSHHDKVTSIKDF